MELKFECPTCGQHISATPAEIGVTGPCPHCNTAVTVPNVSTLPPSLPPSPQPQSPPVAQVAAPVHSPPVKASIKKASSIAGVGCAIQGLGLVCVVLAIVTIKTVVGPVIFGVLGLWLLFYGGRKASWLECSACGGKLSHRRVSLCPHCNASFR